MALTASDIVASSSLDADTIVKSPSRRLISLTALAITLAGWAAYSNSFGGAYTYDDNGSIAQNPTIQQGWWAALHPSGEQATSSGRPLLNLSLALNYHLGGFNVWGYHAFNLVIQVLAGLTLFGLMRRTLERPMLRNKYNSSALPLAFMIALLWTVHPLQTESVTFIVQRAESMMGLFYLLTLYCFVRGVESSCAWVWYLWSVTACLLGMVTKETMVTAPLMVLLYDRTFVAGTFASAWRQRWKLYAALAGTWTPLAWLVATVSSGRVGIENSGANTLPPLTESYFYALKQCEAIVHYLGLSFWPQPLVFYYGSDVVSDPREVAPQIVILALLVGATVYALWRRPALGFLGAWFFVILAPTSSVVPVSGNTMAEHHMYLSLAALVALAMLGLHAVLGRRAYLVSLALAFGLGGLTYERNRDYRTNVILCSDIVQKLPDNWSSHSRMIAAFEEAGRPLDAMAQYGTFMNLDSDKSAVEDSQGNTQMASGQVQDAIIHYQQAIKLNPGLPELYYHLGNAYRAAGKSQLARDAYLRALSIDPNYAAVHNNLGSLYLVNFGQVDQAIVEYEAALRTNPYLFQVQVNLGNLYIKANRAAAAIPLYQAAIKTQPNYADAHAGLGFALLLTGRANDAIPQFETALQLAPENAGTHNNYGLALLQVNRFADAAYQFEKTLSLDPRYPNTQANLDKARQLASTQPPASSSAK